jgi:hypothetical protein
LTANKGAFHLYDADCAVVQCGSFYGHANSKNLSDAE